MKTKYKLIIKADDFVLYEAVYNISEEKLQEMLRKAHQSNYSYNEIDRDYLVRLINETIELDEEHEEYTRFYHSFDESVDYSSKYPDFVIASVISQMMFSIGIFNGLNDLESLFSRKEADTKFEEDKTGLLEWECHPVD